MARLCPAIKRLRFLFDSAHCPTFLSLQQFPALTALSLCGGQFYTDGLLDLLELAGSKLVELSLYAVDQLDTKAVALTSVYCSQLVKLDYSQCGFREEEMWRSAEQGAGLPVQELVQQFRCLQQLQLSSECPPPLTR